MIDAVLIQHSHSPTLITPSFTYRKLFMHFAALIYARTSHCRNNLNIPIVSNNQMLSHKHAKDILKIYYMLASNVHIFSPI